MTVESTRVVSRRVRWGLAGALLLLAFESPGCGGIVREGGGRDQDGGVVGEGGTGGTYVSPPGTLPPSAGKGGAVTGRRCGNGVQEPGEACDGTNLVGTCGTETMGTRPIGVLRCSSTCSIDSSGCRSYGVGGAIGAGGFMGTGGRSSQNACYDANGVPTQAGGCAYGPSAEKLCAERTNNGGPSGNCYGYCACSTCPGSYTRCLQDGGCAWILGCTQQYSCANIQDCYKMGCSQMIDRAGGLNSAGAHYADSLLACIYASGCGCGIPL